MLNATINLVKWGTLAVVLLLSQFVCAQELPNLAPAEKDGKWGYVDRDLNWQIKASYEFAAPFINGYAAVTSKGKKGLIDTKGKFAVPAKYDNIKPV